MSLRDAPWWGAFVSGLRYRPVAAFAAELGVDEAALIDALVAADPGGPAESAPWWPEALRMRATASLREIARRFGAEPRRVRRGLARTGVRVAGQDLDGRGVPALAALRTRLGREPDAVLAREAGVPVEAVRGERRRLRIPAFYPGAPAPTLSPEEEAWIRGPEPTRRGRLRAESEGVEVVRRPTARTADRSEEGDEARAHDARSDARAQDSRSDARTHEHRAEPRGREASGEPAGEPRFGEPRFGEQRSGEPRFGEQRSGEPRFGDPRPGERGDDRPGEHRVPRDFFRTRTPLDLEQLLAPAARPRDGRQRIVRAPLPRSAPLGADERPEPTSTLAGPSGLPGVGANGLPGTMPGAGPAVPSGRAEAGSPPVATPRRRLVLSVPSATTAAGSASRTSAPVPPVATEPVATVSVPTPPVPATSASPRATAAAPPPPARVAKAPGRAGKVPAAAADPVASTPALTAPSATPPAGTPPAAIPPTASATVESASVVSASTHATADRAAPVDTIGAAVAAVGALVPWVVRLPEGGPPLHILAPDVVTAAELAAARLPPAVFARVGIERADMPVGAPPEPLDLLPRLPFQPLPAAWVARP